MVNMTAGIVYISLGGIIAESCVCLFFIKSSKNSYLQRKQL